MKNQIFKSERTQRVVFTSFVTTLFLMLMTCAGIMPAFAMQINMNGVNNIMQLVVTIVGTAAKFVGAAISLWGIFQIIMAFRREDSEGISKQIVSVIVGAILIAFGASAGTIYSSLIGG